MSSTTSTTPIDCVDLDHLPRRIMRAQIRWKAALERNLAAEELDDLLAPGAGMVLFALYEADGLTIGEMAKRARTTHVAVLHVIQRLEHSALVERRKCPKDGRVSRVWLTREGRNLEPRMQQLHQRNLDTLTQIMGAKDATTLSALLDRLIEGLSQDTAG